MTYLEAHPEFAAEMRAMLRESGQPLKTASGRVVHVMGGPKAKTMREFCGKVQALHDQAKK
jgi:hypothetical protein